MDVFMEYIVKRKRTMADNLIAALIITATLAVTVFMLMALFLIGLTLSSSQSAAAQFSTIIFGLGLVLVAAAWYGAVWVINLKSIEYEYILTNSEMDIDKIMAKKRRKRVLSVDFKKAELVANVNDDEHNSSYKNQGADIRVCDFTGNKENGNVYFADFMIEGEKTRVLFQPTSKMIESIRKFNPGKVFIKSDY